MSIFCSQGIYIGDLYALSQRVEFIALEGFSSYPVPEASTLSKQSSPFWSESHSFWDDLTLHSIQMRTFLTLLLAYITPSSLLRAGKPKDLLLNLLMIV